MNIDKEREVFEAWIASPPYEKPLGINPEASGFPGQYRAYEVQLAWEAYQAGRAALQSQAIPADDWFDMFMELARAVVVANRLFSVSPTTTKQKVAADAAIALQERARRHPALQSQDAEDAERLNWLESLGSVDVVKALDGTFEVYAPDDDRVYATGGTLREAIDHARRVEEDGEC